MKIILTLLLLIFLSSCGFNKDLKSVIGDLESTPKCDTENMWVHSRDTKETLTGKVVILNSKIDCFDDSQHTNDKKLKGYKEL